MPVTILSARNLKKKSIRKNLIFDAEKKNHDKNHYIGKAAFNFFSTSERLRTSNNASSKSSKKSVSCVCMVILLLILSVFNYFNRIEHPKEYIVCNGLSNQLLGHVGYISKAITSGAKQIFIPDAFIFNGVQNIRRKSVLVNVFPTKENSVPLSHVFDTDALIQKIQEYGVEAELIPYQTVVARDYMKEQQSCDWLRALSSSNHQLAMELLQDLKPSRGFYNLIQTTIANIRNRFKAEKANLSTGICLHHRDGDDWHKHCEQWEGIRDGVWRKNCLNDRRLPLHELVMGRIPPRIPKSWVYYIGDEEPSEDLVGDFKSNGLDLIHREKHHLLSTKDIAKTMNMKSISLQTHRDFFTAVDYFTCAEIESFIGNSVSTFSANQIALRSGMNSSWYNSRSIPLAGLFRVFNVPIVYTYTEESHELTQYMLKASILSVRGNFGSTTNIHILYHGKKDNDFLTWLHNYDVIIHQHQPVWLDDMNSMMQNVDPMRSQTFLHGEHDIGRWQKIDIPLFINAEYCLVMDSDTIVHSKFGMHDFGLDVTRSLAVSGEINEDSDIPWNMGVSLFNVPMLRETYQGFLKFITSQAKTSMLNNSKINEQVVYLKYYENTLQFLDKNFDVKPYQENANIFDKRKIIHFAGLKAHDLLKLYMRYPKNFFPEDIRALIDKIDSRNKNLCLLLHDFSLNIVKDSENLENYCFTEFGSNKTNKAYLTCMELFQKLASEKPEYAKFCRSKFFRMI
mmetsp:Transcript_14690/g.20976  ORF Transcript_14690/g.20976 Transcript_14690/m.20976 type:complete len:737 (-) Transcript_14690:106-2316(-)